MKMPKGSKCSMCGEPLEPFAGVIQDGKRICMDCREKERKKILTEEQKR